MTPPPVEMTIPATDGFALGATEFRAAAPAAGRAVLIAPATGVRRRLYQPFAAYLATQGFHVLTWDWRGTGGSRPPDLRGFPASMTTWATRDLAGAIEWATQTYPGHRLYAVGHSFGGQAVGLAPNAQRLAGLVTVAAPSGYWGHWPRGRRWMLAALWYTAMPALTALLGYFPGRRLGLGEDLPAGVAHEWARWCRTPAYLGDYTLHRRFARPLLALSFTDDPFAPPRAVRALHREYAAARLTERVVAPHQVGATRLGHTGFFAAGRAPELWAEVAAWLRAA